MYNILKTKIQLAQMSINVLYTNLMATRLNSGYGLLYMYAPLVQDAGSLQVIKSFFVRLSKQFNSITRVTN